MEQPRAEQFAQSHTADPKASDLRFSLKAALEPAVRNALYPIGVSDIGVPSGNASACRLEPAFHVIGGRGREWSKRLRQRLRLRAPDWPRSTCGNHLKARGRARSPFRYRDSRRARGRT